MPKRRNPHPTSNRAKPVRRRPGAGATLDPQARADVAAYTHEFQLALDDPDPIVFLRIAASISGQVARGSAGDSDFIDDPGVLRALLDADTPPSDALVGALAVLAPAAQVRSARHPLPAWIERLGEARVTTTVAAEDPLRDEDTLLVEVTLATGDAFPLTVFIDHNLGSVVAKVITRPNPVSALLGEVRQSGDSSALLELPAADMAERLRESIRWTADARPAGVDLMDEDDPLDGRPLLDWAIRLMPAGGTGWPTTAWHDDDLARLTAEVAASATPPLDADEQDIVKIAMTWAARLPIGDPWRWTPASVDTFLDDWLPTKLVIDAESQATMPRAMSALIREAHKRRGMHEEITRSTLRTVEDWHAEHKE